MPRFTLRDLFWCVTLLAVGIAGVCWTFKANNLQMLDRNSTMYRWEYYHFAAFVAASAAMTAGVFAPFQRIKTGLLMGFVVALAIVLFSRLGSPEWIQFSDPPGDFNTAIPSAPLS